MSFKTKIIFTADDFGVENSINEGIIDLVQKGIINSVEVLPNFGPKGEKSVYNTLKLIDAAANIPHLELGIHFTITSGNALTNHSDLKPILETGSNINEFVSFQTLNSKASYEAVKGELLAQANVLLGNPKIAPFITHISNHHDALWFYPPYTRALIDIANQLNLPVRNPRSYPASRTWVYYALQNKIKLAKKSKDRSQIEGAYELRKLGFFPNQSLSYCTTDYMDNRFYGVMDNFFAADPRDVHAALRAKRRKIKNMFDKAAAAGPYGKRAEIIEFMFHLRKGKVMDAELAGKATHVAGYKGIDLAYFDGRTIEYLALHKYKDFILEQLNSEYLTTGSWSDCKDFILFAKNNTNSMSKSSVV
ncbi:ChbG/HpnK family deacetylase [Crocinitomix catalasitica]|uniref:ChbG/HpnK family deacetylase n=1 Tax=Crocinitomix catalasitica TaxID=184607 RepID=UPI00048262E7|nr:ChbG/HpnK family deacetylase [Crocinitomix catalasitica]